MTRMIESQIVPGMMIPAAEPPPLNIGDGPGTEAVYITRDFGAPECDRCKEYARWMNAIGVEGCKQKRDEIIRHFEDEKKHLSWLELMLVGAKALANGLPLSPAGLVDEAIRRAEVKEKERAAIQPQTFPSAGCGGCGS